MAHAKQYGPSFARNALIPLDNISVDAEAGSSWREVSDTRVQELYEEFIAGHFGLTVTCGVHTHP